MQVVILCGGKGTRIRDVSEGLLPKPMVTVGNRPILWHVMKHYAEFGHTDFILCLGHQSWKIKEYFLNYRAMSSDLQVRLGSPDVQCLTNGADEGWSITLAETGLETMTAGRVKRISKYLRDEDFLLTYGDGLADVDVSGLVDFHREHKRALTMTGVMPPGRFGELGLTGLQVHEMREKPSDSDRWINGGFMVVRRDFIERYLPGDMDDVMLEREPLEQCARDGETMIWKHRGFWQCMDTYRDWEMLNRLAENEPPPWRAK